MSSDDEDALFVSLENDTENDPSIAHLREVRMQALASELSHAKAQRNEGYGTYVRITDEKKLMETTTCTKYCVVHFYKPDFNRCRIMDDHLSALASVHLQTRFLGIDVEHAPFLVTKLSIRVLPCVIAFTDGVSVERIVGFEGLSIGDEFETAVLERRLVGCGVMEKEKGPGDARFRGVNRSMEERNNIERGDDEDEDEWD